MTRVVDNKMAFDIARALVNSNNVVPDELQTAADEFWDKARQGLVIWQRGGVVADGALDIRECARRASSRSNRMLHVCQRVCHMLIIILSVHCTFIFAFLSIVQDIEAVE